MIMKAYNKKIYLFMNSAPGLGLVLLEITQDEYEGRFSSAPPPLPGSMCRFVRDEALLLEVGNLA